MHGIYTYIYIYDICRERESDLAAQVLSLARQVTIVYPDKLQVEFPEASRKLAGRFPEACRAFRPERPCCEILGLVA